MENIRTKIYHGVIILLTLSKYVYFLKKKLNIYSHSSPGNIEEFLDLRLSGIVAELPFLTI